MSRGKPLEAIFYLTCQVSLRVRREVFLSEVIYDTINSMEKEPTFQVDKIIPSAEGPSTPEKISAVAEKVSKIMEYPPHDTSDLGRIVEGVFAECHTEKGYTNRLDQLGFQPDEIKQLGEQFKKDEDKPYRIFVKEGGQTVYHGPAHSYGETYKTGLAAKFSEQSLLWGAAQFLAEPDDKERRSLFAKFAGSPFPPLRALFIKDRNEARLRRVSRQAVKSMASNSAQLEREVGALTDMGGMVRDADGEIMSVDDQKRERRAFASTVSILSKYIDQQLKR